MELMCDGTDPWYNEATYSYELNQDGSGVRSSEAFNPEYLLTCDERVFDKYNQTIELTTFLGGNSQCNSSTDPVTSRITFKFSGNFPLELTAYGAIDEDGQSRYTGDMVITHVEKIRVNDGMVDPTHFFSDLFSVRDGKHKKFGEVERKAIERDETLSPLIIKMNKVSANGQTTTASMQHFIYDGKNNLRESFVYYSPGKDGNWDTTEDNLYRERSFY